MSDIRDKIQDLNRLVLEGKALEAFDKYYADDCLMQEGDAEPTIGKESNREREQDFFSKITEFRDARVKSVSIGDDTSAVEWHFDYTHADWGPVKYDQVAVQRWRDGKIVSERFYRA